MAQRSDERPDEPPNVPYIQHQFNRNLYDQWEAMRSADKDAKEDYAPFGVVEGRPPDESQIEGPPDWEVIWPPDTAYVGEEWNEPAPYDQPLTETQKQECKSDLIKSVTFIRNLGRGAFGQVWEVQAEYRYGDIYPWKVLKFACKILRHRFDGIQGIDLSLNEMRILRYLRHENICNMAECLGIIDSVTKFPFSVICIFFELCDGSFRDIFPIKQNPAQFPVGAKKFTLSETLSKHWFSQILKGLEYIHNQDIIHMDIKEENILFKYRVYNPNDSYDNKFLSATFKLADFGLSRVETNRASIKRYQKQDLKQLYDLLLHYGIPGPKTGTREESMFVLYCKQNVWKDSYPEEWKDVSPELRSMFSKLSNARPTVTADVTAKELLALPWCQQELLAQPNDYYSIDFRPSLWSDWEKQRKDRTLHKRYYPFGWVPEQYKRFDVKNFEWQTRTRRRALHGPPTKWQLFQFGLDELPAAPNPPQPPPPPPLPPLPPALQPDIVLEE